MCPVTFSEVKDYVYWQYRPIIAIFCVAHHHVADAQRLHACDVRCMNKFCGEWILSSVRLPAPPVGDVFLRLGDLHV